MIERPLSPFGVEWTGSWGADGLPGLAVEPLRDAVATHRFALLRGCRPPDDGELLTFCRRLGEVLEWDFGAVNELRPSADARNYLYTHREVPFHWDGAFVGRVPSYIVFVCATAPPAGDGGETTFCDTVGLLSDQPLDVQDAWRRIRITYTTEKVMHYGGSFTSPVVARHPKTGEAVMRFAEPVHDLNPVSLEVDGVDAPEPFLSRMHELLNDPRYCHEHSWRAGDILIADNHALLHGRRAFTRGAPRHLRRVNVM